MRKFALVILDIEDKVTDRYNLDFVTDPQGLGYELDVAILHGNTSDTPTKITQVRNTITFTVNQNTNAYKKANALVLWIQQYSRPEHTMALEYDDGEIVRYCVGLMTKDDKTELNVFRNLPLRFTFKQFSGFFVKRENTITIATTAVGKTYPHTYPYSYGRSEINNNDIDNNYFEKIPLIITIKGAIVNPKVELYNEQNQVYNRVQVNVTLHDEDELVINSAQKKIYKIANGNTTDCVPDVDPRYNKFLNAQIGYSRIGFNSVGTSAVLTGGWREYRL